MVGVNDFRGVSLSLRSINSIKFTKLVFVVNGDLFFSELCSHEASFKMFSKFCKAWSFTCGVIKPGL